MKKAIEGFSHRYSQKELSEILVLVWAHKSWDDFRSIKETLDPHATAEPFRDLKCRGGIIECAFNREVTLSL